MNIKCCCCFNMHFIIIVVFAAAVLFYSCCCLEYIQTTKQNNTTEQKMVGMCNNSTQLGSSLTALNTTRAFISMYLQWKKCWKLLHCPHALLLFLQQQQHFYYACRHAIMHSHSAAATKKSFENMLLAQWRHNVENSNTTSFAVCNAIENHVGGCCFAANFEV